MIYDNSRGTLAKSIVTMIAQHGNLHYLYLTNPGRSGDAYVHLWCQPDSPIVGTDDPMLTINLDVRSMRDFSWSPPISILHPVYLMANKSADPANTSGNLTDPVIYLLLYDEDGV